MANPLLDFVMSVVRDPDVAAHYAADPAGAIAAADLSGVTTADVAQLIPVVTESLGSFGSRSSAGGGVPAFGAPDSGVNVWTGSAATAAFDAFDTVGSVQPPDTGFHQVISDPGVGGFDGAVPQPAAAPALADEAPWHVDPAVADPAIPALDPVQWQHSVDPTAAAVEHHQGFDFFS